jgi:hypothetical protein
MGAIFVGAVLFSRWRRRFVGSSTCFIGSELHKEGIACMSILETKTFAKFWALSRQQRKSADGKDRSPQSFPMRGQDHIFNLISGRYVPTLARSFSLEYRAPAPRTGEKG